jgi:hypothetical protein
MLLGEMDGIALEEEARLAEVGIHVVGDESPAVRAECTRIGRRLLAARTRVIGFIPTQPDVAVPPVAIQLGLSLVELSGATAAYVDANARYPALAELSVGGDRESAYSTRWLKGSLALLTPSGVDSAGEAVPALANLLLDGTELFEHVLVDLTGFDLLGEHAAAAACMDGVVLVGRAHATREKHILSYVHDIPEARLLGVLLVG